MDFPKEYCPNVTTPCWIPHADSVIHEQVLQGLPQCDTIEKYSCMMKALLWAKECAKECAKSCAAESYKIMTSHNTIEPFLKVRRCGISTISTTDSVLSLQKGKIWAAYIIPGYQSFTESLYKEADVYDFNTVVASVGGSLGLFLGFSCYEHGKKLIDLVGTARP